MQKILTILLGCLLVSTVYAQTDKVGINTTTPAATLDIKSSGNTSTTKALSISNSSNTEMVTVTDEGKVGVGTDVPKSKLHISSENGAAITIQNNQFLESQGALNQTIVFADKDTTNYAYVGEISAAKIFGVITHGSNYENMIGAAELYPESSPLHGSGFLKSSSTVTTRGYGAHNRIVFKSSHELGTPEAAAHSISIDSLGRMGIGTNTPSAKLDIASEDGASLVIRNLSKAHTDVNLMNYIAFRDNSNNEYAFIGEGSSGRRINLASHYGYNVELATHTSNTAASQNSSLFLNGTTGNIGIDTNAPDEKLHVIGKVKATNFIATTTGSSIPDYVFEKYYTGDSKLNVDYKFLTLDQIEKFVKKEGHLPGYASAKEVEQSGVLDMKQTQLTHLEKIEELYLHTIEQEKKIKKQNQRIEKLETLIEELLKSKN